MNKRFKTDPEDAIVVFQDSLDFANDFADCPICHIMKRGHFHEMISRRLNTFVKCIKWEDVKEGFGYSIRIPEKEGGDSNAASIEHWKNDIYGQCWSLNRPSQYMMEEYDGSDIIVMSTVGKVFDGFYSFTSSQEMNPGIKAGKILYCIPENIQSAWSSLEQTATNDDINQKVMGYFLKKQVKYAYENEVRFFIDGTYFHNHPTEWKENGVWKYDIDVEHMITQVIVPNNVPQDVLSSIREEMTSAGIGHRLVTSETLRKI